MIRCPNCRNKVLKKSTDGKTRLRTRTIYWDKNDKCHGICEKCRKPVPIPLVLLGQPQDEKLVVLD